MTDAPPLHVCRISHGFPPRRDGLSHHVHLLSRHQVRLGHHVKVFQPLMADQILDAIEVRRIVAGRHALDPRRRRDRWLFSALAARAAARSHRRRPFDLIHCHGDAMDGAAAVMVARRFRIPFVLTLHAALSRRLRHRLVASAVFRLVSRFIVVGEHIGADLVRLGVPAGQVAVISSGIEYDRFAGHGVVDRATSRREIGIPDDAILIMAVGRLHEMKGFAYLIAAAQSLPPGVAVAIVGDGPLRRTLEQAARGLEHVRFCGSVAHDRVPALLAAADVFVLPSVDLPGQAEGTPTAALEAMAAGLPLVVTDSGGMHAAVSASGGGLVVPQRDSRRLAEALRTLADDADRRVRLGALNRAWVRGRDWPVVAARVTDVYREAIASRAGTRD